jgi:hypothetical protein
LSKNPALKRRRYKPTRLFDKFNPYWDNYDRRNNAIFVGKVLGELNDLLRERGYVYLDDALGRLGFELPDGLEGQFEGWVYEPDPKYGDGYISVGVWDQGFTDGMDWINGKSDILVMRFNIDRVPLCVSMNAKKQKEEQ